MSNSRPLYSALQVTLDATGSGTVRFQPSGEDWNITFLSVNVSTRTLEAQARVYRGQIGDAFYVDGSISGSSGDTSDTVHDMKDGEALYVVWTGGDVGGIATAIIRGTAGNFSTGGFRAFS